MTILARLPEPYQATQNRLYARSACALVDPDGRPIVAAALPASIEINALARRHSRQGHYSWRGSGLPRPASHHRRS